MIQRTEILEKLDRGLRELLSGDTLKGETLLPVIVRSSREGLEQVQRMVRAEEGIVREVFQHYNAISATLSVSMIRSLTSHPEVLGIESEYVMEVAGRD